MTTAYVTHDRYVEHHLAGHPEHAGRIKAVWTAMDKAGLMAKVNQLEAKMVSESDILAVHSPNYLELLKWTAQSGQERIHFDADTYGSATVYEIARLSAGGVVAAVDSVVSGRSENALAAVRPPGHHAMPDHAMGFCILGNVPIATRFAQQNYGLKRVMIVDFDVHHGNGTEAMFYDDPSVLFISTHQYPFYPGTGSITDIGSGKGKGFTINIPLGAGHGDHSYAELFQHVVWPAARRYEPELIIVSAGFDAHWLDPIAGMRLTLKGYDAMSRELIRMANEFCSGKIVFVMEGGYNLEALSNGIVNIAHALIGDEIVNDPLGPPHKRDEPEIASVIRKLQAIHNL